MLPHAYQIPALLLLVGGGAVSCFAGHRLFRAVLAIYGFVIGAMLASSTMGATNTAGMVIAAIGGGIVGALVLVFAYLIGVALVGAGLGALIAHVAWTGAAAGDPPSAVVVVLSILGAIGAMVLQRYVIVVATAFGGAWTILVGVLALAGDRGAVRAAASGSVWILYPMTPAIGQRWVPVVWVVLGLVGTAVQLGVAGKKR